MLQASAADYRRLGLETTATEREIKVAYRKLALQHHPDRGGDEETFKAIGNAYEAIANAGFKPLPPETTFFNTRPGYTAPPAPAPRARPGYTAPPAPGPRSRPNPTPASPFSDPFDDEEFWRNFGADFRHDTYTGPETRSSTNRSFSFGSSPKKKAEPLSLSEKKTRDTLFGFCIMAAVAAHYVKPVQRTAQTFAEKTGIFTWRKITLQTLKNEKREWASNGIIRRFSGFILASIVTGISIEQMEHITGLPFEDQKLLNHLLALGAFTSTYDLLTYLCTPLEVNQPSQPQK